MIVVCVIALFGLLARPTIVPGYLPGPMPVNTQTDASDYAHMAQSLLHGSVLVDYDGPPHLTRYTPGFPVLLMPAVALGGLEAAVWVCYVCTLALGALASLVAWRVGGPLAAIAAAVLVLFNVGSFIMAQIVMSDVASAALTMAELAVLMWGNSRRTSVLAGLLGRALVWVRPGSMLLALAVPPALSANRDWARLRWFAAALLGPIVLLGIWQWHTFGSPLVTSYQATGASGSGTSDIGAFVSLRYVLGPPWNAAATGTTPNPLVYVLGVLGIDSPYTYPGLGLVGVMGAIWLSRARGATAVLGRFTCQATVLLTLVLYVPYFYQDIRFLVIPIELLHVVTAVALARGIRWLCAQLAIHRGVPSTV